MTTTLFKILGAATTLATVVLTAGSASAGSLSYSTSSGGFQATDFDTTLSVQKFNSALGNLKKVTVDFAGDFQGDGKFENRSSIARTVTVTLGGLLSLEQGSLLPPTVFELNPQEVFTYNVSAFDGIIDFNGTSGRTFNNLIATGSASKVFTDVASLGVFTGTGNLNFLFSAFGNSTVAGSGNMTSQINTWAKSNLRVTYEYDPKAVPEPSAALGFGLMAGVGLLSQRKKSWFKTSH